jgi:hypothetical protein
VDPEGVRFPTRSKGLAELRGPTVIGVREDRPVGDSETEDPIDEREPDPPLLLELYLGRDSGLFSTAWSFAPPLRKVESDAAGEPDQIRVVRRSGKDVVEADPDLAVRTLSEGPAPLASHSHGSAALLRKGGVIERDPPLGRGEPAGHDLDEPGLKEVGWPGGVGEELLDLIDSGPGEPIGDRLHGLALPGKQKPEEVGAGIGASIGGSNPRFPEGREGAKELGKTSAPKLGKLGPRHPGKVGLPR